MPFNLRSRVVGANPPESEGSLQASSRKRSTRDTGASRSSPQQPHEAEPTKIRISNRQRKHRTGVAFDQPSGPTTGGRARQKQDNLEQQSHPPPKRRRHGNQERSAEEHHQRDDDDSEEDEYEPSPAFLRDINEGIHGSPLTSRTSFEQDKRRRGASPPQDRVTREPEAVPLDDSDDDDSDDDDSDEDEADAQLQRERERERQRLEEQAERREAEAEAEAREEAEWRQKEQYIMRDRLARQQREAAAQAVWQQRHRQFAAFVASTHQMRT